jgi:adenosine deaminase
MTAYRETPLDAPNTRSGFRSFSKLSPVEIEGLKTREIDFAWIRQLPKADLHFHIGTSLKHDTIEALALNSTGYFLDSNLPNGYRRRLIRDVCQITIVAQFLCGARCESSGSHYPLTAPEALWLASRALLRDRCLSRRGKMTPPNLPTKDLYDHIVAWLTPLDTPYLAFETCSLLVSAIAIFKMLAEAAVGDQAECKRRLLERWRYLTTLADSAQPGTSSAAMGQLSPLSSHLARLAFLLERIHYNWHDVLTSAHKPGRTIQKLSYDVTNRVPRIFELLANSFDESLHESDRWVPLVLESVLELAGTISPQHPISIGPAEAERVRSSLLKVHQIGDIGRKAAHFFGLSSLVELPEGPDLSPKPKSLQRYLWGAGLLGAEHFQYPENILLAGYDLVRQGVEDNIIYNEVRCAPHGYCVGGLQPHDATDLLCVAFDLAACYFGSTAQEGLKRTWVRTNILLGAKSHKGRPDLQAVVNLLTSYLSRRKDPMPDLPPYMADNPWWKPCSVIGFDLSGDEATRSHGGHKFIDKHRDLIEPLFEYSAPTTIHAGEAAVARSIWDAVHYLGAQRIGHGLRIRENLDLFHHCIDRGICMELCPISNAFTNEFVPFPREVNVSSEQPFGNREYYPLRFFLAHGLDVCLNTDNRYLHAKHALTDEFLEAARLSGGLTRWEALKLIKTAFKHAFLPKQEIASVLAHVESLIMERLTDM